MSDLNFNEKFIQNSCSKMTVSYLIQRGFLDAFFKIIKIHYKMNRKKRVTINDVLNYICDGESDFELGDPDSDYESD